METIQIDNISQYSIKVVNGSLVITPKDPVSIKHVSSFKKEIRSNRKIAPPKTPDPNRCVEKHEEFEDELWIPNGMISKGTVYPLCDRQKVIPCKCTKTTLFHNNMSDKDWYKHRKEVNRYRRMCANNRVIRPLPIEQMKVPEPEPVSISLDDSDSEDEYSMQNIIKRMDRDELILDLKVKGVSFMSGHTDHELRTLLCRVYNV